MCIIQFHELGSSLFRLAFGRLEKLHSFRHPKIPACRQQANSMRILGVKDMIFVLWG